MNKNSFLFLLIIIAVALIGAYQPLVSSSGQTGFIRFFALSGYLLLCVSLILGPLTMFRPQMFGQLIEPRRAIGISAFVFAVLHILILFIRLNWNLAPLFKTIDPLISIPAAIILLILTMISSDYAIKKLGPAVWKNIQRFNYLAFVLVTVHFIRKANGLELAGVNLSEVVLLILGIVTVLLQVGGFITRREKLKAVKTS